MRKLHILYVVGLVLGMQMLVSCSSSDSSSRTYTAAEITEECASGVVLIQNNYYYEIQIAGLKPAYFTDMQEGEIVGLTFDPEKIQVQTSYGTGFFINENGYIATNAHVADPAIDGKSARSSIVSQFGELCDAFGEEYNELNDKISLVLAEMNNRGASGELKALYQTLNEQRDEAQKMVNRLREISGAEYEIMVHTDLSIAYTDTHVSKTSDFEDCVLLKSDHDHDLAIMQLKSKRTPEDKYIFEVYDDIEGDEQDCPVGTQLYLIGYNYGPSLAITSEGLKPQTLQGAITQNTDQKQMMYSIPTLGGSSGSPVVDEYGDLVAVNYAGLGNTQSFNYGIKVKHLSNLLNK